MPSVKNLENGDMMGISKIVNEEKDKNDQCSSSPKDQKKGQKLEKDAVGWNFDFLERESSLSLGFRPIGSSVLDEGRSKTVLRGEGYAWAPIWWSSDNSKR